MLAGTITTIVVMETVTVAGPLGECFGIRPGPCPNLEGAIRCGQFQVVRDESTPISSHR